jgi:hypothetical protein
MTRQNSSGDSSKIVTVNQHRSYLEVSMPYYRGYSGRGAGIEIDDSFRKWILGLVVPIPVVIYAFACIITQHATFGGSRGPGLELVGVGAIAHGLMILGFALFGHFHCFWGECEGKEAVAVIGKVATFLTATVSLGVVLWTIMF